MVKFNLTHSTHWIVVVVVVFPNSKEVIWIVHETFRVNKMKIKSQSKCKSKYPVRVITIIITDPRPFVGRSHLKYLPKGS